MISDKQFVAAVNEVAHRNETDLTHLLDLVMNSEQQFSKYQLAGVLTTIAAREEVLGIFTRVEFENGAETEPYFIPSEAIDAYDDQPDIEDIETIRARKEDSERFFG